MNKKFLAYQIKNLLPMLVGMSIVLLFVAFLSGIFSDVTVFVRTGETEIKGSALAVIPLVIFFFVFLFSLPQRVLDYQYKRQISDTYLQIPMGRNALRIQIVLVPFVMLLIGFTLAFWAEVGIYASRVAATKPYLSEMENTAIYSPYYLGYLYAYLHFVFAGFCLYAFVACMSSISNSARSASLTSGLGLTALSLAPAAVASFFNVGSDFYSTPYMFSGVALPIVMQNTVFQNIIASDFSGTIGSYQLPIFIISVVLAYLPGILSVFYYFFVPEKKGELAGSKSYCPWYVKVPAFLGMMMLIMFTSPLFGIFRLASGPLFLVLTYFIMAVYDSSFKIDLASGIMIGIEGLVFITGVVINRQ